LCYMQLRELSKETMKSVQKDSLESFKNQQPKKWR